MKLARLVLLFVLMTAGCGPAASPDPAAEETARKPVRLPTTSPSLTPQVTYRLVYDEADVQASAKRWRDGQCEADAEHAWPELPDGPRRRSLELTVAVARGDLAAVERLLARGADPGFSTPDDMGPLAEAALCNHPAILRRLLKAGAPVDRRYQWTVGRLVYRQTALMIAAQHGSEEAVRILLAAGADPNLQQLGRYEDERQFVPSGATLVLAETDAVAQLLLDGRADPNLATDSVTPLMTAARMRNRERIGMMLQHGADPSLRDEEGLTALDYARRCRSPEAMEMLLPVTRTH